MLTKAELRRRHLALRRAIDPIERVERSARAAINLMRSVAFQAAQTICLYAPVRGEADPAAVEDAARDRGSVVLYPRRDIGDRAMPSLVFCPAFKEELVPTTLGLLEPSPELPPTPLPAIDLVVVPGVVFGRRGERIGFGKGFYDRALADLRGAGPDAIAIGFGFDCQVQDQLPEEAWDRRLDGLATESRLVMFDRRMISRRR